MRLLRSGRAVSEHRKPHCRVAFDTASICSTVLCQIFGAPSWATSDRFDIVATMSAGEPFNPARVRRMLRALLAERFKLVAREERREMPVYSLVLAKPDRTLGVRLRPFKGKCAKRQSSKVTLPDLTKPLPPSDGGPE